MRRSIVLAVVAALGLTTPPAVGVGSASDPNGAAREVRYKCPKYEAYQNERLRGVSGKKVGMLRARFSWDLNRSCVAFSSAVHRHRRHRMSIQLCRDAQLERCRPRVSRLAKRHLPRQFFPTMACFYVKVSIKNPAGRELVRPRDRVVELAC